MSYQFYHPGRDAVSGAFFEEEEEGFQNGYCCCCGGRLLLRPANYVGTYRGTQVNYLGRPNLTCSYVRVVRVCVLM